MRPSSLILAAGLVALVGFCLVRRNGPRSARASAGLQPAFEGRNSPASPITLATTPLTSIHIARSVGAPVKNREMSEPAELVALIPKITKIMPPARRASEMVLFIGEFPF
jgi:hypothetical protein